MVVPDAQQQRRMNGDERHGIIIQNVRAPAHRRYCRCALQRFKACMTAAQLPGELPPSFRLSRRKGAGIYRSAGLIGREVRAVLD
jgi:hypothetical protein